MPELAEVAWSRKQWNPGLKQKILALSLHPRTRVFREIRQPRLLLKALEGNPFISSRAHGKQLLFQFGETAWLTVHLGMTGKLSTAAARHHPGKHEHFVLHQQKRSLVFSDPRMFGALRLHLGSGPPPEWQKLPPEMLSPEFSKKRLAEILSRRARTPLKALLLEQSFFPGIGNWMADEILWHSRIPPQTPAGHLSPGRINDLWKSTRHVSRGALLHVAEKPRLTAKDNPSHTHHSDPVSWGSPPRSWLFQHRWQDGGRCPRCRTALVRESLRQRTTCWCPNCQK